MYKAHFCLRELPFGITPDTSFFFGCASYQAALNTLLIATNSGEGFIKITGEVGTGKTLLCRKFMASLDASFVTAYLPNPYLEPRTFMLALADKLDTLVGFFTIGEQPTGSRDPFALRRSALGIVELISKNVIRLPIQHGCAMITSFLAEQVHSAILAKINFSPIANITGPHIGLNDIGDAVIVNYGNQVFELDLGSAGPSIAALYQSAVVGDTFVEWKIAPFLTERLKLSQREAGVRHDLIDAVFVLGNEDDLIRLLMRVHALQAMLATDNGSNLLGGVKRAVNILRIEEGKSEAFAPQSNAALFTELAENALGTVLDSAVPAITGAVEREDFTAAMTALAALRPAIDAFFDTVIVNAPDPLVRANRLGLLARVRAAANSVADFSRIEG